MHKFNEKINLRVNDDLNASDTSIWPSFTDIMTVVLMIFMIIMTAVIIKNSDLYEQLLLSKNTEKKAVETLEESKTIIADLEEKLHSKEMEIILINDEMEFVRSSLDAKVAIISMLEDSAENRKKHIQELESMTISMRMNYERQMAVISENTKRKIEEFNRKFAYLSDSLNKSNQIILVLNSEKKDLALTLAKERNTYSALEKKYNKLIRAARSPAGKKVVTVHYSKADGKYRILFKGIEATTFEKVDQQEMHQRLASLKEKWKKSLYVKVIIPNKSGLTYNEAWSFTRNVLSAYDYYYQE
jgi:chromosome segregation ATPase